MQTTDTAPDLKELNHYWRLLAGLTNEVDAALHQGEQTPEQRLVKIGELVAFARLHMARRVPPSVVAEDMARPERQAAESSIAAALQAREDRRAAGEPVYHYKPNAEGQMEGPFVSAPENGPLTEEEVETMLREGWPDE